MVVEPSDALRSRIVALLEKSCPGDEVVREALDRAQSPEAEEERKSRRTRIRDERIRNLEKHQGTPPADAVAPVGEGGGAEAF